jgi:ATP-dependent Clp protease ATP-binding subunit ClpB
MAKQTVTDATSKVIEQTISIARENGNSSVEPLHLAVALFDAIGDHVCTHAPEVDINLVRRNLQQLLLKKPSQTPAPLEASLSSSLSQLLQRSTKAAKANGDALVTLDHLFIALYDDREVVGAFLEAGLTKKLAQTAVDGLRCRQQTDPLVKLEERLKEIGFWDCRNG